MYAKQNYLNFSYSEFFTNFQLIFMVIFFSIFNFYKKF